MNITPVTEINKRILVVDDEEMNRRLLKDLLSVHGYEVETANDGEEALTKTRSFKPHTILLDVMMPKLDGFQTCEQLKQDQTTTAIPVLMVTALNGRSDRLKGINAGASDFLNKPIDHGEVLLRVRNSVQTKLLYDRVQEDLQQLRKLEDLRDNLIHMVVHDMKNPLWGALGYLDMLRMQNLDEEQAEFINESMTSLRGLSEMITSLLDVSRMESGKMPINRQDTGLADIVEKSMQALGTLTNDKNVRLNVEKNSRANCDPDIIVRVLINIISNALKYTYGDREVVVSVSTDADGSRFSVTDGGPGIPPEFREKIFEKFGRVETSRKGFRLSTGLGLTFCKLAVETHGGSIGVNSEVGHGSTFWFTLPATAATEA